MTGRTAARIEAAVDGGAALLFAAAVAYALWALASAQSGTAAAGIAAFAVCFAGLRRIPSSAAAPEEPRIVTPVAHLLAEADRSLAHAEDELVLEDILAALGPDSRVVRLFEPGAMPTPGEMKARIDRHLEADEQAATPDASQALHDALAELRRSLN